jgi:hypothetical protein
MDHDVIHPPDRRLIICTQRAPGATPAASFLNELAHMTIVLIYAAKTMQYISAILVGTHFDPQKLFFFLFHLFANEA